MRTYTEREVHRKECLVDAIHLPVGLTLPSAFGAPAQPLQVGQVIQALVLELIESDVFRLQLPQATIDVRSSVPLTPGATITLAVRGTGPNARLAIYSDLPPASGSLLAKGATPAPNLTARMPIGEAVVIARAPAAQGTPAGPQSAAAEGRNAASAARAIPQPAALREAASVPAPAARQMEAPLHIVTPEQAVTEAIQSAAPRQAGLAPLFADLEQTVRAPNGPQSPIPAPLRQAAADVLSLRVPLDEQLTAADLKQALVRSGVLFEPKLALDVLPSRAAGASQTLDLRPRELHLAEPGTPLDQKIAPPPRDDLKAALIVLRQVLRAWAREPAGPPPASAAVRPASAPPDAAGGQPSLPAGGAPALRDVQTIRTIANALAALPAETMPASSLPSGPLSPDEATGLAKTLASALMTRDAPVPQPASGAGAAAPPYRGAPLAAQPVAAPSIASDAAPQEIAHRLIAETDGALARQTLLQVASLPEQPNHPRAEATYRWNFEIPFATPQGTAIAQFEVSRDGGAPQTDPQTCTWRARFSLDVEPMGPVHALVALSGARTSVTLWAERGTTATRLNENGAMLGEALRAAELEPADVQFRVGAPPAMAKQAVPGRFMDRAS